MDIVMVEFVCWIAVLSLAVAFIWTVLAKWKVWEWLQVHAPNDFLYRLFQCKFCCSWWMSVAGAVVISLVLGNWLYLLLPVGSSVIACRLW